MGDRKDDNNAGRGEEETMCESCEGKDSVGRSRYEEVEVENESWNGVGK